MRHVGIDATVKGESIRIRVEGMIGLSMIINRLISQSGEELVDVSNAFDRAQLRAMAGGGFC
jgi:hypothetical protein